jgi:hypothetical protein
MLKNLNAIPYALINAFIDFLAVFILLVLQKFDRRLFGGVSDLGIFFLG